VFDRILGLAALAAAPVEFVLTLLVGTHLGRRIILN
jgi:hypothetical protein